MNSIEIERKKINLKDFKRRRANTEDFNNLIKESTIIKINNEVEIVYIDNIEEDINKMYEAINSIKYNKSYRTNGLISTSRIFGYSPRNQTRNSPCRITNLAIEFPRQHSIVEKGAEIAKKYYELYNPKKAREHQELTENNILPEYRISNTMYTSGIINENNPLKYHFDSGNFSNTWSAMFGFRKNTEGGYLSLPELELGIEIKNNSLLLFDGQSILHGVTPIKMLNKDSKRYTIVYYSLKQMWNCKPLNEEVIYWKMRRNEIEQKERNIIHKKGE